MLNIRTGQPLNHPATACVFLALLVAGPAPALAQDVAQDAAPPDTRQTDVSVGYLRPGCMNGLNAQFSSEQTPRLGAVAEFNMAVGTDCSAEGAPPRYKDFAILGGLRVSWYPSAKTTVFVQALGGFLHSTAGAYTTHYQASDGSTKSYANPALTIDYLALQPGGGVTLMFTPRFGVRAQADLQYAIPDQSQWEGISIFPRVAAGGVVRLGRQLATRPPPPPPSLRLKPVSQTEAGGPKPARWDVAAAVGRLANPESGVDPTTAYRFYAGHYWTPHLKVDGRVTLPVDGGWYEREDFPVPGLPGGGYLSTRVDTELKTAAFGVTYQFRENAMVHPYVSAGVQVDHESVHRFRNEAMQFGYIGPDPSTRAAYLAYTVPAFDERSTHVRARPYGGGGVKFYVNRWLFARTELIWGQSRMLEAGMGVDF